mmetsp:Transcript_11326/g.24226  ORF Transcript_11326/g.24226 Transcript_11326/m.24226 type:complete len:243 (+) Transcript_11326:251-979(+)
MGCRRKITRISESLQAYGDCARTAAPSLSMTSRSRSITKRGTFTWFGWCPRASATSCSRCAWSSTASRTIFPNWRRSSWMNVPWDTLNSTTATAAALQANISTRRWATASRARATHRAPTARASATSAPLASTATSPPLPLRPSAASTVPTAPCARGTQRSRRSCSRRTTGGSHQCQWNCARAPLPPSHHATAARAPLRMDTARKATAARSARSALPTTSSSPRQRTSARTVRALRAWRSQC